MAWKAACQSLGSGIARIIDRFDQTEVDRVIAFEEKYH